MTRGTSPFRHIGLCPNLALLSSACAAAIEVEQPQSKPPQVDEATQRHLDALAAVGIEQPQEILNKLDELTKRLPVSLNDLVAATVKACRRHNEPEGGRPQISNIILIEPAAQPLNLIQFTARLQATSDDLARFIEQMPGPSPKRSKNKRGQRSQQKPWHPKFRRLS